MSNIKPILFNTAMVQAILYGRKTQTRRIIKHPPNNTNNTNNINTLNCPYGQPGDLLWVREKFGYCSKGWLFYYADRKLGQWDVKRWKPSIHMPKAIARIWLEIKSIKVERLQDISEDDAKVEGVMHVIDKATGYCAYDYPSEDLIPSLYKNYRSLWESIHGPGAWQQNPLVWVVEFKVITTVISKYATPQCCWYRNGKCADGIDWKNKDGDSVCGHSYDIKVSLELLPPPPQTEDLDWEFL